MEAVKQFFNKWNANRLRCDGDVWQELSISDDGKMELSWQHVPMPRKIEPVPQTVSAHYTKINNMPQLKQAGFRYRINAGVVEKWSCQEFSEWRWAKEDGLNPGDLANNPEFVLMATADEQALPSCDHDFIVSSTTGKDWCRKCGEYRA